MREENRHKSDTPTTQKGTIPIRLSSDAARHRAPWELSVYVGGKRKRTFHATEKEAVAAWTNHKRIVRKWGTLPLAFSAEAQAEYDHCRRKLAGAVTLTEAVDWYVANTPREASPLLGDAVKSFLAAKAALHRSPLHAKSLRVSLQRLTEAMPPDVKLSSTTRNQVLDLLLGMPRAPRTLRNLRHVWHNFFRWHQRRGGLLVNPTDGIDENDMPAVIQKPKVILTVAQAQGFMRTIQARHPHLIRWAAVQAFAGMRDAESERMRTDYCDAKRRVIHVPAEICKTADAWVMTGLPAVLWDWFAVAPPLEGGFPYPSNRKWAEIAQELRLLPDPERIPRWPFNALRRSFCTYAISLHGSADKVATWSRHRGASRLYASYLGALVSKTTAREYFGISPQR